MTDRERRRRRAIRQRQKRLRAEMMKSLMLQTVIVFIVMITALSNVSSKAEETSAEQDAQVEHESVAINNTMQNLDYQVTTKASEEVKEPEVGYYPAFTYSKDWDADDSYLLAKIAMAEAEGCNMQTKTLVILTVLNRVWSDEFPGTIHDVIFEEDQFSPIDNGRWDRVEPNEDCWEAVQLVMEAQYDYSGGALYFESCEGESWHSRNLTFLYESESIKFYK